jgi:hypothetical protein
MIFFFFFLCSKSRLNVREQHLREKTHKNNKEIEKQDKIGEIHEKFKTQAHRSHLLWVVAVG